MHDPYDDDDYDDDNNYDNLEDKYKHYFKFDPEAWDVWGKWLYDALSDVVEFSPNVWYTHGFPSNSFPVNSYFSNTGKDNTFQYLGNNYDGAKIWKKKYFVHSQIDIDYFNHLRSNAVHFLNQPQYYQGLFEILN